LWCEFVFEFSSKKEKLDLGLSVTFLSKRVLKSDEGGENEVDLKKNSKMLLF